MKTATTVHEKHMLTKHMSAERKCAKCGSTWCYDCNPDDTNETCGSCGKALT